MGGVARGWSNSQRPKTIAQGGSHRLVDYVSELEFELHAPAPVGLFVEAVPALLVGWLNARHVARLRPIGVVKG
jgi:hypothetical protein